MEIEKGKKKKKKGTVGSQAAHQGKSPRKYLVRSQDSASRYLVRVPKGGKDHEVVVGMSLSTI